MPRPNGMPPPPAFFLWRQAAETGDWDGLLSLPVSGDVEDAVWLLAHFPPLRSRQAQDLAEMVRAALMGG